MKSEVCYMQGFIEQNVNFYLVKKIAPPWEQICRHHPQKAELQPFLNFKVERYPLLAQQWKSPEIAVSS